MSPLNYRSSSGRQLFAVATAAFIILQPVLFAFRAAAAAQVKRTSPTARPSVGTVPKISIITLGVPITESFDTLATSGTANPWTDDSTLAGWYSQFSATPTNPTTYRADNGASNAGAIYSYGTGTDVERAFGSVSSGTPVDIFNALKLTNNTGSTITSLDISYNGEQWRNGGNISAQQLDFQYQVSTPGTITDANSPSTGWTDFDSLDFVSPTTGATAAALDGNEAANRTAKSANLAVLVNNGQEIWLRWKDINDAGNDHGLAVDDLSVTANGGTPTPTLNIGDVAMAEGNSGTTAFNFAVSLTSPAGLGGVTFNASTADGIATTGSGDYVSFTNQAGSIPEGSSSTTVTVNVNGDTTTETNETFFVNVTNVVGATAGDVQGLGTIQNDDVTLTPIYTIQGSGTASTFNGQIVSTTGIVTGIKAGSSGGFFIQDPNGDGNVNTSDGVFVFTGATVPAGAVIGNNVQVTGRVSEFVFTSDPNSPPVTEISSVSSTIVLSTGNPIPGPHVITAAETTAPSGTTNPLDSLEEFEGMRVSVPSLMVVAPTDGNITEPSATVASTGVFYGVVTGVARPFREPGIAISDPVPAPNPSNVPRFDENPERIRVDSDGQPGTTALDIAAGTVITNLVGELDYSFRTYTVLPEAANPPIVGTQPGSTPVPTQTADEFTVASFNMERFFDTVNDPGGDPVLTAAAYDRRLNKASLIIRTVQKLPDVIGVEEVEHLTTLQDVANRVNSDTLTATGTDPQYQAYLVEGNDIGGIDNGFLVKSSRITVVDVTQIELAGCDHVTPSTCYNYTNPNNGTLDILNDRPPLVLRAAIPRPAGGALAFTVIVNHLRSLNSIDDPTPDGSGTVGARVREKRRKQAEFLANLIQTRQTSDATEKIISVGDMNAFQVNDGYVDVIGTIKGTPAPPDQVVLASSDLVNPDLTDLVETLLPDQRYSFTFDGNAQVLDHIILNQPALAILNRFAYARDDADFPVKNYELTNELRISDHDQPVAYLSLDVPQPQGSVIISEFRLRGPFGFGDESPSGRKKSTATGRPTLTEGQVFADSTNEFIEIYNNTDSAITVATSDGSSGWAVVSSDGSTLFEIPNGTIIPARGHYLATNTDGYTLDDYGGTFAGSGDVFFSGDIPDDGGVALFRTSDPANFTSAVRLDAAGYTAAPALYREGAGLPTGGPEFGSQVEEFSLFRDMRNAGGFPKDTGDNAADFLLASVDAFSTGPRLGAPGPENLFSPLSRNTTFGAGLLDTAVGGSLPPNRVRDLNPGDNAMFGTMSVRRTFTNNTGMPVTKLRFRIVDVTTFAPPTGFIADLRAIDSPDVIVTLTNNQPVTVRGTTVEQPPGQPNGGGWNSSLDVGFITLGEPLNNGASVNVQFIVGVQQKGSFRFFLNIEAGDQRPFISQQRAHARRL